jgi:hypothetical protein
MSERCTYSQVWMNECYPHFSASVLALVLDAVSLDTVTTS